MQHEPTSDDERTAGDSPYASPQADAAERGASTFSLATLMVLVVLCAVGFGIAYYTVGLGVAYSIIVVMAFVRIKLHHRTAWVTGVGASAISVLLIGILLPVCCSAAFFTNCLAGAFAADQLKLGYPYSHDTAILLAFGLGGITALQVAEMIFAFLLRKKSHETP